MPRFRRGTRFGRVIVLAIDQGTSGTKAIVVDGSGEVLALAEVPVRPSYLPDGGVEQDPGELLDSVLAAGRQALDSAGVSADVVALANQGETVLAWDPASGQPLSPAIVWQDGRSESVCVAVREHADELAARTGLVLDPYFSAPKMAWLRRNVTTEGVVTTSDSWLVHQLTGEFVTDVTTASRSLVLDLDSVQWDPELLGMFGLADEPLPRLVACDEVVGSTTAFGGELPVGGLIVDQQAALLAEGCLAPGSAKCTYGTGAFLLANAGPVPARSTHGLTTSVAWRTREGTPYCMDAQVFTVASALRWLVQLGLLTSSRDLDSESAPDSDGVLFVPALAGLAAPWWQPDARASFAGLSLATSRGGIVRAVVEGIAAQVAALVDVVDADMGARIDCLRVDGGLTHSRVLMQTQADLLQRPVEVYASPHATALGAAAVGRMSVMPSCALADAIPSAAPAETFEPRWSADRAADAMARWRAAVDRDLSMAVAR